VHLALSHIGLLATAVTWDPYIRGVLIIVVFIVLLPGSVYLVLSTDVGARVGFLLIAAGMSGMLCMLALLWMPLGSTADIGRPNSWKPLEVITGDYASQITIKSAASLPVSNLASVKAPTVPLQSKHWYWPLQSCNDDSWHKIDPSLLSDPEATSDTILANTAGKVVGPTLSSPFSATTDYSYVDGYRLGQNSGCLIAINRHKVYMPLARGTDIVVLRVRPVLPTLALGGAPPPAVPDTTKPLTYIVLERNLGSVRQPQALMAISMGLTFFAICYILHTREKEQDEKDAAEGGSGGSGGTGSPAGAGPSPEREKVGAGV
jgi:hypothetical protein